jgi:hypothetical protein
MMGSIDRCAGPLAPAPGDVPGATPGDRPDEVSPVAETPAGAAGTGEEARRRTATGLVYAALCRAADAGAPCPSNRELCAAAEIALEARVSRVLANLCARRMITVEWTVPATGLRRVVIRATGRRTDWSRHGRRWPDDANVASGAGLYGLELALARTGRRFDDVTAAEARRIARLTPVDPGLPPAPAASSYMGSPLARLMRHEPDAAEEGEAIAAGQ